MESRIYYGYVWRKWKMKKIIIIIGIAVGVIAIVVIGALFIFRPNAAKSYQYVKLSKGDIKNVVTCTGTLQFTDEQNIEPLTSGIVSRLYVDYNSKVKKGQLLATIDDTLLSLSVLQSQAALEKAISDFDTAQKNLSDTKDLFAKNYKAQTDVDTAQNAFQTADSAVKNARLTLQIAQVNLGYTRITAPINGVIVQRNISVGQQVSAGSATPAFVIATDISLMQALMSVDESDISQVKQGLSATFSVQAYQDSKFEGTVSQTWLVPTIVQNVVNYTVVVDVVNKDGKLLPGMTATMDIIVNQKTGVLRVPQAALKFQPTPDMYRAAFAGRNQGRGGNNQGGSSANQNGSQSQNAGGGNNTGNSASNRTGGTGNRQGGPRTANLLWVLDEKTGKVNPVRIKLGITDGQWTEVIADSLSDGMQVVSGIVSGQTATTRSTQGTNPFQQQQQRGGFGPGR
jgi:HlyD family secretion protein